MIRRFGRRVEPPPLPDWEPEPAAPAAPLGRPFTALAPAPPPGAHEAADEALRRLRVQVIERVDPEVAATLPAQALRSQLVSLVHEIASDERIEISAREQRRIATELADDMVGYGPLEPLLQDDGINDIMVNGPDRVFIEVNGKVELTDVRFRNAAQLAAIAQKMAASVGRRVDESSPLVDCRLADGSRVNVVFPPLSVDGVCISIRKFSRRRMDLTTMVEGGSMSHPLARVLEIAARCRLNIIISGGTGSGKTTLMNAMSRLIDRDERIVTIEDAAELQLQQPHVIRLETRPMNLEGRGEVTQRDLLRNALRMRPDRIIVGEVRGAEAFDMLQAMNTGHDGSFCTVHANSARDAIVRIENMVQMGQPNLPVRAIRTQIASAVDLVVQVARMRDGGRRVLEVSELRGLEGDMVTMNEIFAFDYRFDGSSERINGQWRGGRNRPGFMERLEQFGLSDAWMQAVSAD